MCTVVCEAAFKCFSVLKLLHVGSVLKADHALCFSLRQRLQAVCLHSLTLCASSSFFILSKAFKMINQRAEPGHLNSYRQNEGIKQEKCRCLIFRANKSEFENRPCPPRHNGTVPFYVSVLLLSPGFIFTFLQ